MLSLFSPYTVLKCFVVAEFVHMLIYGQRRYCGPLACLVG